MCLNTFYYLILGGCMSQNHFKALPTTPFGIHAMEPQLNTLQDDLPDQPPIKTEPAS